MESLPFNVVTYKGTETEHTIYLLNKGLHSCKPSLKPYRNSFAIICQSAEDVERYFMAFLVLYYSRVYECYIIGTAIPFIRKPDLVRVLKNNIHLFNNDEALTMQIERMNGINNKIAYFKQTVTLMEQLLKAYCLKMTTYRP